MHASPAGLRCHGEPPTRRPPLHHARLRAFSGHEGLSGLHAPHGSKPQRLPGHSLHAAHTYAATDWAGLTSAAAEANVALLEVETPREGLLLVMVTTRAVRGQDELLLDYGAPRVECGWLQGSFRQDAGQRAPLPQPCLGLCACAGTQGPRQPAAMPVLWRLWTDSTNLDSVCAGPEFWLHHEAEMARLHKIAVRTLPGL